MKHLAKKIYFLFTLMTFCFCAQTPEKNESKVLTYEYGTLEKVLQTVQQIEEDGGGNRQTLFHNISEFRTAWWEYLLKNPKEFGHENCPITPLITAHILFAGQVACPIPYNPRNPNIIKKFIKKYLDKINMIKPPKRGRELVA